MGVVTKAFKSGNSVAVRLPKELGIVEGTEFELERTGSGVLLRRKRKRTPKELAELLLKMPGPKQVEERENILFPKRRGL